MIKIPAPVIAVASVVAVAAGAAIAYLCTKPGPSEAEDAHDDQSPRNANDDY